MKVVTYWETAPGAVMPPYVALGIASMRAVLGESFLLLSDRIAPTYIGSRYLEKEWTFERVNPGLSPAVASIVAKSDYIRAEYIHQHGGFWLDADTIAIKNFLPFVSSVLERGKLYWHSEAFFGGLNGNVILKEAANRMLSSARQTWGNPGGIKDLLKESDCVSEIPYKYINPGYVSGYSYKNCNVLLSVDVSVESFLSNPDVKLLKMYNTDFSMTDLGKMSLEEFFSCGALISRIFLRINSDVGYWKDAVAAVTEV